MTYCDHPQPDSQFKRDMERYAMRQKLKVVPTIKERPILFSAPMVRALLDGSKAQTRRIMKPQPEPSQDERGGHRWPSKAHQSMLHVEEEMQKWTGLAGDACPHGDIDDRLWVRETFAVYGDDEQYVVHYRATNQVPGSGWKPSIFMPRKLSRITLEITGVRVERLNDISEADARAEGAKCADRATGREVIFPDQSQHCGSWILHYREIWESINGAGSWDANPWVWVIEFKRVA
jgi:hypothetical protein